MASERNDRDDDTSRDDDTRDKDRGEDDQADSKEKKKSPFANPWVKIAIAVVVVLLIVGGVIWWLIARNYEDTDDAFIDTHIVHISPQIAGQVLAVRVNDNQPVRKGQMLLEIDPADADARLAQVRAQELQAHTQLAQARASEAGARAQQVSAARDLARYQALARTAPAAVAQQQIDQARAAADNARALEAVLAGARNAYRDIAVLNAAAALVVAGAVPTLADGLARTQDAIDSGAARATLARLVKASNERANGQECR